MTIWCIDIMFSGIVLGVVAYGIVWAFHNFEILVDTVMVWADKQETFLQKMISCNVCLTAQVSTALSAVHCLVFDRGLWTWFLLSGCVFVFGLSLNRGQFLDEE